MKLIFSFGILCLAFTGQARAAIDWRLSIKLIADFDGVVPTNWAPRIIEELTRANQIMSRSGRGYGFDLIEVVTLTGVPQWNWIPVNGNSRDDLHNAARAQPALYGYRTDAINVYVAANACLRHCPLADAGGDIILMSGDSLNTPLLHLCGHFFNLLHTHEGQTFRNDNGADCGLAEKCGCSRQFPGDADGTIETAPDNQCFDSADIIARAAYNLPFADLDVIRQGRVENSLFNIMSYHANPDRLTSDQFDFLTNDSNTRRRNVATGVTWFVATDGHDANSGLTSNSRFKTVGKALSTAGPRLLRAGNYAAPQTINQPVTLRASRGDVKLARP